MAERLAIVAEQSTIGSPAAYRQGSIYRDWIRTVSVSGAQIRSTLLSNSRSGHSGSSYSSSDPSGNNSGCLSGSGSASATSLDWGAHELTTIARQMVNDGYTERVVEAFNVASPPPTAATPEYGDRAALENWFSELDVDWVLQIREGYTAVHRQDKSLLQDLVGKWIRALTVIIASIRELDQGTLAVARFGKASIAKMLLFVGAIVPAALKAENLRAVLDMYTCVSNASHVITPFEMGRQTMFPEAQSIIAEVGSSLAREAERLNSAIFSTMKEVVEDDDLWAIEIPRGGGEVHRNTRFMVDCIVSIRETRNSILSYRARRIPYCFSL